MKGSGENKSADSAVLKINSVRRKRTCEKRKKGFRGERKGRRAEEKKGSDSAKGK